jgi:hypothetical protein
MNKWNITAPPRYIDQIRTSKYFKLSLGQSLTVQKNEGRALRENTFTTWYHKNVGSLIFKKGEIGLLSFFIDHYINDDIIGFFLSDNPDKHKYAIKWEQDYIDEYGIDSWLSKKLKEADEEVDNIGKNKGKKEDNTGDPDKLKNNPGQVTWKDIEAFYMTRQRKHRSL